jgi:large subunit ribosomal protein L23
MTSPYEIIERPVITERATILGESKDKPQYVFKVRRDANKIQIARAIEHIYKVKVASVNTILVKGKRKRQGRSEGSRANWKKAFVVLEPGQTLEVI